MTPLQSADSMSAYAEDDGAGGSAVGGGERRLVPPDDDDAASSVHAEGEGARLHRAEEGAAAREADDDYAADCAMAGTNWQVRQGGLVFATAALRHALPAAGVHSLVGGFLAPLPFVLRMLAAQLVGLLVFHTKAPACGPAAWRPAHVYMAVLSVAVAADLVLSLLLCAGTHTTLDALFREPSPGAPVNTYWRQTYAFFQAVAVLDVLLAAIAAAPLARAFHSACCPAWQPAAGSLVRRLCFVRQGLMPHPLAVRARKYLAPLCAATAACNAGAVLLAALVWAGVWGAWTPGVQCSSFAMDTTECYPIPHACDPLDPRCATPHCLYGSVGLSVCTCVYLHMDMYISRYI